jgi:hypothetical protein
MAETIAKSTKISSKVFFSWKLKLIFHIISFEKFLVVKPSKISSEVAVLN